jgi:hypothetical protein
MITMAEEMTDRVRANTAPEINQWLDGQTRANVAFYGRQSKEVISRRIEELEGEWDMERYLEMNASLLAFTGVTLGMLGKRRWFLVPSLVLPFLFVHAVQGWCPPLRLFRKRGVRTRQEIDAEKYALKVLRGDYDGLSHVNDAEGRAVEAWQVSRD